MMVAIRLSICHKSFLLSLRILHFHIRFIELNLGLLNHLIIIVTIRLTFIEIFLIQRGESHSTHLLIILKCLTVSAALKCFVVKFFTLLGTTLNAFLFLLSTISLYNSPFAKENLITTSAFMWILYDSDLRNLP
jgi:hypothetical protein